MGNKVVEQKRGFLSNWKKNQLVENFNVKYFAKIDLTNDKEIFIEGSKVRLIKDHASSSYIIVPDGNNYKIQIMNPSDFWKISKYLVVMFY